ncbi:hypothetical protein ACY3VG_002231 [Salmonella bongori]
MLSFSNEGHKILLGYTPEEVPSKYVYDKLEKDEIYIITKVFHFTLDNLVSELDENNEFDTIWFTLAEEECDYYRIDSKILDIKNDIYFHRNIKLTRKYFVAERKVSIF